MAEDNDNVTGADEAAIPIEEDDRTTLQDDGENLSSDNDIVIGEIVDDDLTDGEIVVPRDWMDNDDVQPDPSDAADLNQTPNDSIEAMNAAGALPSDLELDAIAADDDLENALTAEEGAEEEVAFDFTDFNADEARDDLDYEGIGDDDAAIGVASAPVRPRKSEPDIGGDELIGALPSHISDSVLNDGELQAALGGDVPEDEYDTWATALDGHWEFNVAAAPNRMRQVEEEFLEHGVEMASLGRPPVAALYGGTAALDGGLVDESLLQYDGAVEPMGNPAQPAAPRPPNSEGATSGAHAIDVAPDVEAQESLDSEADGAPVGHESIVEPIEITNAAELLAAGRPEQPASETGQVFGGLTLIEASPVVIEELAAGDADEFLSIEVELDDDEVTFVFDEELPEHVAGDDTLSRALFSRLDPSPGQVATPITANPLLGPFGNAIPDTPGAVPGMIQVPILDPIVDVEPALVDGFLPQVDLGQPQLPSLETLPTFIGTRNRDLFEFCRQEALNGDNRETVARHLHAMGRLFVEEVDRPELAREAMMFAQANDPGFRLNDFYLTSLLEAAGDPKPLFEYLVSKNALAPGRCQQVVHLYRDASQEDPGILERLGAPHDFGFHLARYLDAVKGFDWTQAYASADLMEDAASGAALKAAIRLERVRLATELTEARAPLQWSLEMLGQAADISATCAAAELLALEQGDTDATILVLQRRYAASLANNGADWVPRRDILIKLARAYERGGLLSEALHSYTAYLEHEKGDRHVLGQACRLAYAAGRFAEYRGYLDALAETALTPRDAAMHYYEKGAFLQRHSGDEASAVEAFHMALAALPTFTPALSRLSRISRLQGRSEEINQRYIDEIHQLETALKGELAPEKRRKTIDGLVRRYFRLATNLERAGLSERAADLYKRALALDADCAPALSALARELGLQGEWSDLVGLLVGWSLRTKSGSKASVHALLYAADIARTHLNDADTAIRLTARVMNAVPTHRYALRRGAELYAENGQVEEWAEALERLGQLGTGRESADLILKAALLREIAGNSRGAEELAGRQYKSLMDSGSEDPVVLDAYLRTFRSYALGSEGPAVDTANILGQRSKHLALSAVHALISSGMFVEAGRFVDAWRAQRLAEDSLSTEVEHLTLGLQVVIRTELSNWSGVVDALDELSRCLPTADEIARCLCKAGEISEAQLGDRLAAIEYYRRAQGLESDLQAPVQALFRLGADVRPIVDAPTSAVQADVDLTVDKESTFASRCRQFKQAGDDKSFVAELGRWLPHTHGPQRERLRLTLLGALVRLNHMKAAAALAEEILAEDPDNLTARLLAQRLATSHGDTDAAQEHLLSAERVLRSPSSRAQLLFGQTRETATGGQLPTGTLKLLAQAYLDDPDNDALADRLEAALRAAQNFEALDAHFRDRLKRMPAGGARLALVKRRAELLATEFGETRSAYRLLEDEFSHGSPDLAVVLYAAELADAAGLYEEVDGLLEQAAAASDAEERARIETTHATSLLARGDSEGALVLGTAILKDFPTNVSALRLVADASAACQNWKQAVLAMRRLIEYLEAPAERAMSAASIGEIFSRVYGDEGKASGWFKRAIEINPVDGALLNRFLASVQAAPQGIEAVEHVSDAIDRALTAQLEAFEREPTALRYVKEMARLHGLRHDRLSEWRCRTVLGWFGHEHTSMPEDRRVTEMVQVDEQQLSRMLRPDALNRNVASLYDSFWQTVSEVTIEHMPAGVPRISRRSFSAWQDDFHKVRLQLRVGEVELWNGGRSLDTFLATYLPHPAMAIPLTRLEGRLDALHLFHVGRAIESLRDGGLLLQRYAPKWFARLFHDATRQALNGANSPLSDESAQRFLGRIQKAPRSKRLILEQHGIESNRLVAEFAGLRDAHVEKMDRAGLSVAGDLEIALGALFGSEASVASGHHKRVAEYAVNPRAQRLVLFYLSPLFAQLRPDADVSDRI